MDSLKETFVFSATTRDEEALEAFHRGDVLVDPTGTGKLTDFLKGHRLFKATELIGLDRVQRLGLHVVTARRSDWVD